MEHKILERVFKQGIMTLVMMLVFLSPMNLCADQLFIDSETDLPCNTSIWDITGNYYDNVLDCYLMLTMSQDAKGKITGYGCDGCSVYGVDLNFCYDIKGKIKQKRGIATVKIKMKINGTVDGAKFKGTETVKAEIDPYSQALIGVIKVKACVKGVGCESGKSAFYDDLPYGMDGSWFLEINAYDDGKKIMGDGLLILANGRQVNMTAKGKINTKKEEAKVKFKGLKTDADSKGSKLLIKLDENDNVLSIKGKVLNQKIQCK